MRADKPPVEQSVPKQAQQKLKAALSHPDLVHPDWVRTMLRGEAGQSVFNDAMAAATGPVFQALLSSSPVVDRIDNLVEELIDEYESLGAD